MAWKKKANLKGPEGAEGKTGEKGPSNVLTIGTVTTITDTTPASAVLTGTSPSQVLNLKLPRGIAAPEAAPTDGALASFLGTEGTQTNGVMGTAIETRVATPERAVTAGGALEKMNAAVAPNVTLTGDSLLYGQDDPAGTNPPINGATQKRSTRYPALALSAMLTFVAQTKKPTITEHSFPGDRTTEVLTRWADSGSGDVEIIWIGTNDANNYGGYPSGPVTTAVTVAQLQTILDRSRSRGSQPVVIGSLPTNTVAASAKVFATSEAMRQLCQRRGVLWIDVQDLLSTYPSAEIWTDTVHLKAAVYNLIGSRLAALMGPKGLNPVKVAPGKVILPKHMTHSGGTITARPTATDGSTILLATGETMAIPLNGVAPTDVVVKFYTDTATSGLGRAGMHYALGASGIENRFVQFDTPTNRPHPVRAHSFGIGPDVLVIRCDTGSTEIDSIHFIAPDKPLVFGAVETAKTWRNSRIAGTVLGLPGGVAGQDGFWAAAADQFTPVATHNGVSNLEAKISVSLQIGTVFAAGGLAGLAVHSSFSPNDGHMMWSGYLIARNDTNGLVIREFDKGVVTNLVTIPSVFITGTWTGNLTFAVGADGKASVYMDAVLIGTPFTPKWKTFFPGVTTRSTTPLTVNACTVFGHTQSI